MVRTFKIEEIDQLQKLIQETIDISYPIYYPDRAVQFFKQYHSRSKIVDRYENGEIVIIEQDDEIVATGSLVDNEISGVFVQPALQKSGFGSQIMNALETQAREKGIREIVLHISLPSRRFYELLNYEVSEPHYLDVGGGQRLKYWKGNKKIA